MLVIGPRTRADPMYSNIYRSAVACGIDARWALAGCGIPADAAGWRPTHIVLAGQQINTPQEMGGVDVGQRPGIAVVAIWTDASYDWAPPRIALRDPFVDLHVSLGDPWREPKPEKPALVLWTPIDTDTFCPRRREPEAGVFFRGAMTEPRASALTALHAAKVPTYPASGAMAQLRMPLEAYAGWMRASAAALNTAEGKDRGSLGPQLKGRAIEALLSGVPLLERLPSPVSDYLEDGREFLGWRTEDELVAHARKCVALDPAAQAIGHLGRVAAMGCFSPREWWDRVLAAA